ncbi:hypothetical protein BC833DRAFT_567321 [Globomyces pollinis-pini]|nr:hypothetical protein BC833DRAFT_567321 [Globomyces pollinis-pini]
MAHYALANSCKEESWDSLLLVMYMNLSLIHSNTVDALDWFKHHKKVPICHIRLRFKENHQFLLNGPFNLLKIISIKTDKETDQFIYFVVSFCSSMSIQLLNSLFLRLYKSVLQRVSNTIPYLGSMPFEQLTNWSEEHVDAR